MNKTLYTILTLAKMSINAGKNHVRRFFRVQDHDFSVFQNEEASAMNKARLDHLASLNLDLGGKSVLEVGAGIGLLTHFFESRGCSVLSTDSREGNVREIRRRYPKRNVRILDLERESGFHNLGQYDVVFCYGTLYHLKDPDKSLQLLSKVCRQMILIETGVTAGNNMDVNTVTETGHVANQASSWIGCRPTRPYVMTALEKHFGYAYLSKYQPDHPDFELDWKNPKSDRLLRAIFVGSKMPMSNGKLLNYLPNDQSIDKNA